MDAGHAARAGRLRRIVLADRPAAHDPAAQRHVEQGRLQDRAADIVEIDVDAVGREFGDAPAQRLVLVVDAGVEAESIGHPGAFLRPAGDADRPAAEIVRDLADEHADGAGRGGHQHRLARLRPADMDQAVIGGLAGDAVERDQVAERAHIGRQLLHAVHLVRGVILPAQRAADDIAGREPLRLARDDDADAVAVHDVAGADPLAVGVALHPGPVGGVEREQQGADLDLAGLRRRRRAGAHLEMAVLQLAGRSFDQEDLTVRFGHRAFPPCSTRREALGEMHFVRTHTRFFFHRHLSCYPGRSAATIRGPESPGTASPYGPFDRLSACPEFAEGAGPWAPDRVRGGNLGFRISTDRPGAN